MNNTQTLETREKVPSVVTFRLERRVFALPLQVIVQVLPMMTITPIPNLSHIVKGTINLHGESVLVVSLREHFKMEEKPLELHTPLLLLNLSLHNQKLALIVDEVLDVASLALEKLDTLDHMLPEGIKNTPIVQGMAYFNDETVLVLNPEHLFYAHSSTVKNNHEARPVVKPDAPATPATPAAKKVPAKKASAVKKAPARAAKKTSVAKDAPGAVDAPDVSSTEGKPA